jgi:predicted GNAT superfamily acetyltransferase
LAPILEKISEQTELCLMSKMKKEPWELLILDQPGQMKSIEDLQRAVWPGSETEVVPLHLLVTVAKNGGLVIGAYERAKESGPEESEISGTGQMMGFVHGFPGLYFTPDGPRPKHCSHQLGVHPAHRGKGVGFALKRAQWQMVRQQGLDLITWTFDPLLSRNAHLNITRLGGVTNTYKRDFYGELQDELNSGLITDRFQIDWWVNSRRVSHRLSQKARPPLDLAHYLSAEARILNPSTIRQDGLLRPADDIDLGNVRPNQDGDTILLVEIPPDFLHLRKADKALGESWRYHTREIFENLFERGYLVTDFVHLPGTSSRSFYVLSHGESTL